MTTKSIGIDAAANSGGLVGSVAAFSPAVSRLRALRRALRSAPRRRPLWPSGRW